MASPSPSGDSSGGLDRSLLDRLNALKPTSVSLETHTGLSSMITRASAEPSREDALSARLKLLRNQPSDGGRGSPEVAASSPTPAGPARSASGTPSKSARGLESDRMPREEQSVKDSPVAKQRETDSLKALDEDDLDPLLETDDVFLESLLEEVQVPPSNPGQPQQKQQTEFQTPQKQPTTTRPDQEVEIAGGGGDDLPFTPDPDVLHLLEEIEREELSPPARMPGKEDDSDDSDGEVMTVEVDRVLARAYDEARQLDEDEAPVEGDSKAPTRPAVVRVVSASAPAAVKDLAAAEPKTGTDDDDPFHLPAVPSSPPPGTAGASPASATAAQSSLTSTADDSTIASRLAALRLPPSPPLQPPATTSATDPFASLPSAPTAIPDSTAKKSPPLDALLPSAPSFAPESRRWRRLVGRQGYTDADAATWCVVCLELATVKCEGCDGDVYCSRCWKEMHASDRAGFDERGHKGVVFVRG